jgi:dirigent-like protein
MFRSLWKVGLTAGVVAIALGGASFAAADQSGANQHSFKVFDRTVKSTNVDVDNSKTFTIGDQFIFTDQLWTVDRSKRVGTLHGVCTVVATTGGGAAHCVETAHLGTSTLEGSGDTGGSAKNFRQAVIGGTGRFAGAEGQFLIHQISQNDSIVTVQFTS